MGHAHSYPNATIRYHTSDMCLQIDSGTSYLTLYKACNRDPGYFYLNNRIRENYKTPNPKDNGAILTECLTLKNTSTSVAETETNIFYIDGKKIIPIKTTCGIEPPTLCNYSPN